MRGRRRAGVDIRHHAPARERGERCQGHCQQRGAAGAARTPDRGGAASEQAEVTAWQNSRDALLGQLGPEAELPLFIEALVRLSEAQRIDAFVNTAGGAAVGTAGSRGQMPSQAEQVIGAISGTRRVALTVSAFGDYAAISRFVAQIGRLGWVTELGGVEMQRQFPEVMALVNVVVYFRADSAGGSDG